MKAMSPSSAASPVPQLEWHLYRTESGQLQHAPANRGDLTKLARCADAVLPAAVPGTAASAWRDAQAAGAPLPQQTPVEAVAGDHDWWWIAVVEIEAACTVRLHSNGIATRSAVHVDGQETSASESAFAAHEAEIDLEPGEHVVALCCRSLSSMVPPSRPRARWRSSLVPDRRLRWLRTPLIGRIPWAGTAPVIGPWAGLEMTPIDEHEVRIRHVRTRMLEDGQGVVSIGLSSGECAVVHVSCAGAARTLRIGPGETTAELRVADPELWWPSTHGDPVLHALVLEVDDRQTEVRRVGFRTICAERDHGAFRLMVNGQAVYARGAVWAPVDPLGLDGSGEGVDQTVRLLVESGVNLLRVPGTDAYASPALMEACDRHGAMLWQDTPLASVDPPEDETWLQDLAAETEQWARRLGEHPCLAVWSGGSENYQQAVLSGRAPQVWTSTALETTIPRAVGTGAPELVYVANSPMGGTPPTRSDTGLSHYFGVGAYRRPLSDAVTSGVRFAAECLAFGCPPDPATIDEAFPDLGAHGSGDSWSRWRRDGARDPGASWSFEEITQHYARELLGPAPPRGVPREDEVPPGPVSDRPVCSPEQLSAERWTVEHVMTQVLGQWRRADSSCDGAIVLASRDLAPGPGWGLIDAHGRPKAGLRGFAAACARTALVLLDHGLDGLHVHVFHDGAERLRGQVDITTTTAQGGPGPSAQVGVDLAGPGEQVIPVEPELGGFLDITGAWGFGAAAYDGVDVELVPEADSETAGHALRASFLRPGAHGITNR